MCRVDRHCFIANRSARRLNNWLGRELLDSSAVVSHISAPD
jgi:hypothetical protein